MASFFHTYVTIAVYDYHTSQPSVHMLPYSGISGCRVMPPPKSMSNPNPGFCPGRVTQSRQSHQKQLWRKNQRERALLICNIVPSFSALSWCTGQKARKLSSSDSGLAYACERVYQWEAADPEFKGRNIEKLGVFQTYAALHASGFL